MHNWEKLFAFLLRLGFLLCVCYMFVSIKQSFLWWYLLFLWGAFSLFFGVGFWNLVSVFGIGFSWRKLADSSSLEIDRTCPCETEGNPGWMPDMPSKLLRSQHMCADSPMQPQGPWEEGWLPPDQPSPSQAARPGLWVCLETQMVDRCHPGCLVEGGRGREPTLCEGLQWREAGPAGLIGSTGPKSFYLPIMMKGK